MDYLTLAQSLSNKLRNDAQLNRMAYALTRSNNISFRDVERFANALGDSASKLLLSGLNEDTDLSSYCKDVIVPILTQCQQTTINLASYTQGSLNRMFGINANAKIQTDSSRLQNMQDRFDQAETYEEVSFLVEPQTVTNITRSAVTDTIRGNAQLQQDAGFDVVVTRSDSASCCAWCDSMCGTYPIDKVPKDFWRVHRDCTCEFEYHSKLTGTHERITFSSGSKVTESI